MQKTLLYPEDHTLYQGSIVIRRNKYMVQVRSVKLPKLQYKLCDTLDEAIEFKKMINKEYNLSIKKLAYDYGSYCGIIINDDCECLVDKDDMDKINFDLYLQNDGYVMYTSDNNQRKLLHLLIVQNNDKTLVVDHISGVKSDCRKQNLRIVTRSVNSYNKISNNNICGYIGISVRLNGKYIASIKINGKRSSEQFNSIEDAIQWRQQQEAVLPIEYSIGTNKKIIDQQTQVDQILTTEMQEL